MILFSDRNQASAPRPKKENDKRKGAFHMSSVLTDELLRLRAVRQKIIDKRNMKIYGRCCNEEAHVTELLGPPVLGMPAPIKIQRPNTQPLFLSLPSVALLHVPLKHELFSLVL